MWDADATSCVKTVKMHIDFLIADVIEKFNSENECAILSYFAR